MTAATAAKKKPAPAATKKPAPAPQADVVKIPLNKLVASELNVRKTDAGNLDELAASLQAEGQLQNLAVIPQLNGKGKPTGFYEVIAGERRRRAQLLRMERGQIPANHPIDCKVLTAEQAISASLAENERVPLHPADQFEAFQRMSSAGKTPEEIADRFGISPVIVQRRLKLATLAPQLLNIYRKDGITLECLMALALTDDHKLQLEVWDQTIGMHQPALQIRRMLTSQEVDSSKDPRALFVGIEAYTAAGGVVRRDLFSDETHFYLNDSGLLERLTEAKLQGFANQLAQDEGLAWVAVEPDLDLSCIRSRYRKATTEEVALSKKQATRLRQVERELENLAKKRERLEDEEDYDAADALIPKIESLEDEQRELEELAEKPLSSQTEPVGAVVAIGPGGRVSIYRHLVERTQAGQGAPRTQATTSTTTGDAGGDSATRSEETPAAETKISKTLVQRLTAHKTAALMVGLATQPKIALIAVVHKLVLSHFYDEHWSGMLNISGTTTNLRTAAEDIDKSKAAQTMATLQDNLQALLPPASDTIAEDLLQWMLQQSTETLLQLLAYCVANYLDAIRSVPEQRSRADRLQPILGVDMADWWEPTQESYLKHVSLDLITAAVLEGAGQVAAIDLQGLKKGAAVELAEKKLAGLRWLPPLLRTPTTEQGDNQ